MKMKLVGIALALSLGNSAIVQSALPFGTPEDAAFAAEMRAYLEAHDLAGPDRIHSAPHADTDPHGMMLVTFYASGTVSGQTGDLIVKNTYGPEGLSADEVLADPAEDLGAATVMFCREEGHDPENQNWVWAKYLPDWSLDKNPMGMALAGRVAKGMDEGCIGCHSGAGGDDLVFATDHLSR